MTDRKPPPKPAVRVIGGVTATVMGMWVLGLLLLIAVGFLLLSQRVANTPPCISYNASGDAGRIADALDPPLTKLGLDKIVYDSGVVYKRRRLDVSLHRLNGGGTYASICEAGTPNQRWREAAAALEQALLAHGVEKQAQVQRDPDAYQCSPNCVRDADVPVNFPEIEAAGQSGMVSPPQRHN